MSLSSCCDCMQSDAIAINVIVINVTAIKKIVIDVSNGRRVSSKEDYKSHSFFP